MTHPFIKNISFTPAHLKTRIATDEDRRQAEYLRNVRKAMFANMPSTMSRIDVNEIMFSCMASILCSYRNKEPCSTLAAELLENG